MTHEAGKGDSMRPTDKRAFDEGLERIFGKRPSWYVTRDQREKEKADEHRQAQSGQASTTDER